MGFGATRRVRGKRHRHSTAHVRPASHDKKQTRANFQEQNKPLWASGRETKRTRMRVRPFLKHFFFFNLQGSKTGENCATTLPGPWECKLWATPIRNLSGRMRRQILLNGHPAPTSVDRKLHTYTYQKNAPNGLLPTLQFSPPSLCGLPHASEHFCGNKGRTARPAGPHAQGEYHLV